MQLQLLSCILPQALPGINALKEFESSNSGMHSMKPICNRRGKKNHFYLILPYYILVGQSLIPCSFQGTPPKGVLVKDPGLNIAHLKEKIFDTLM